MVIGQVIPDQHFCFGLLRIDQFKRHHHRAFGARIGCLAALGRLEGAWPVVCGQPHPSGRGPGGACRGGIGQGVGQSGFDHAGRQLAVAGAGVSARHGRQHGQALCIGRHPEFGFQGLDGVGNTVQRNQDLQDIAVGLAGRGQLLLPGKRCLQSRIAGAGLQGDVGGPLVKLGIAGFSGSVQQQGKA